MTDKKPAKPYRDFPLFPHATKQWAKKIRGRTHYFRPWSDPDAALAKYLDQRDDLQAGRTPRLTPGDARGLTMRDLANRFLTTKQSLVETRELSPITFANYKAICELVIGKLGRLRHVNDLQSSDFEELRTSFAKGVGLVTLGNMIRQTRTVFKFAFDSDLIDRPVKFGPGFKMPSKRVLRADRQAKPARMFEAAELRRILDESKGPLKTMILLGINCGFGQSDCSSLPASALDLDGGWITFPRPKTAVMRRCPLWPETVTALRECVETRRQPKDEANAGRLFITKQGGCYVRVSPRGANIDGVAQEFAKVLKKLELHGDRRAFYALRHTFETIGGATRDQIAVNAIMGHAAASNDMAAVYRERIDDDRLKVVVDHVRAWLWPEKTKKMPARKRTPEKTVTTKAD